ncbi:MAG: alpha-2-macroglobulin [Rhodocyclaceae bacterium]|nr:alpha-2-macroglobulin [Rhodocyclaceae bacterium]
MQLTRKLFAALAGLSIFVFPLAAQQPPQVANFAPQGEVKDARQVVARFSEPMVSFGDPRSESPFEVDCPVAGRARWADSKNWIYDFETDLPGGLQCRFTLKKGVKSMAGGTLAAASYVLSTGGPSLRVTLPEEGDTVAEDQVFILGLDAPADLASVRENASCAVDGIGERIALEIIEGDTRDKILEQQKDKAYQFFSVLTKRGRLGLAAVKDRRLQDLPVIVAKCARNLPPGATLKLVWGAGIRAAGGGATRAAQSMAYSVRSSFAARLSCTRVNEKAGCTPVLPLTVEFTAPVPRELAERMELVTAAGASVKPKLEQNVDRIESVSFPGPFAPKSQVTIRLPAGFADDSGRAPANAAEFPMQVAIDEDPPLIKFPARFGILESQAEPLLPVSVRNVEAVLKGVSAGSPVKSPASPGEIMRLASEDDRDVARWLTRILQGPEQTGEQLPGAVPLLFGNEAQTGAKPFELPRTNGEAAFEVIGIPLPRPGLYVLEFASARLGAALLGEQKPYYVSAGALVTNLSVHFKRGRESSLVWVTRLQDAGPVEGARVRINDCNGNRYWEGRTGADGSARVDETLPIPDHAYNCPYLVTARHEGDMGLVLSSWNQGIQPWQFNLPVEWRERSTSAHTVTDRPLFRAGETLSMKHFLRRRTSKGFAAVTENLPVQAVLTHEGSGEKFETGITWSNGAGISSLKLPKAAKLGVYSIALTGKKNNVYLESGSVRVEEFRVPLMRAVMKPPAPAIHADKLAVDVQLSYLAGGPAGNAPVTFRSHVQPYSFSFPDYENFSFGGGVPKEGIVAENPYAYAYDPEQDDAGEEGAARANRPVRTQRLNLDGAGGARVVFDKLPAADSAQALQIEMEYSDPNGQIQSAATRALLLPSGLVLGLGLSGSYATPDKLSFRVVALDPQGKPQAGKKLTVDAYTRTVHAYRKRLLGGFYAYEQNAEVKKHGQICSGSSDAQGLLLCSGEAPASGELILVAKGEDAAGNPATAQTQVYVAGGDDWYPAGQSDRIDLIADKLSYEPGDTARFEVRMPFRQATALVTVEREGVLASSVQTITAKSPYVDVKIDDHYGPNAYVSVMVVRGRVDPESPGPFAWLKRMIYRIGMFFGLVRQMPREIDTRPTAIVDLTRPAFKLGAVPIRVGWKAYELKVNVVPERETYRVREQAAFKVSVTDAAGKPAAGAEIALAAVDEGLLALARPDSWKLLDAMMKRRGIEVETSTAQSQVIGKRHFGKKAVAAGGGGAQSARELFDTLLLWRAAIALDEHGEARVTVPLNDSLTSWRVEAIAHAGVDKFGSGGGMIRTTQELMLFSGLPPYVREGDKFTALVTARNGGERALEFDLAARYAGADAPVVLPPQHVKLAPGEASTLEFSAAAPFNASQLVWNFEAQESAGAAATASAGGAHDALKVTQQVGAAYPVRVYEQTLEQLEPGKALGFPAQMPKGAVAGRGGVDVRLARSLGGNVEPIREWMQRYPYTCLEQNVSRAVALENPQQWEALMNALPTYIDRDGLLRYFAASWLQGDDALTSYVLSVAHAAQYEIPQASLERLTTGLVNFVAGRTVRYSALPTADLTLRKLAAIEALSRYDAAQPEMLESLEIAPNLWPSSAVLDWLSILTRMENIPHRDQRLAEARQILRGRLTFSGTTLVFSTEKSDYLWWLMVSPDLNATRALALLSEDAFFREDMPRLARGALSRQRAGRWITTNANAWGVLGLRRFQQKFERDAVTGSTLARLGTTERALDWSAARSRDTGDPTLGTPIGEGVDAHFDWPKGVEQLGLTHQGGGKPWAFIAARAALPLEAPLFAGYTVKRSVTPVEQKKPGAWSRGDVYRVQLEIEAQADMTWVVVSDPIPGGASVLGSGLGGDSTTLTRGEAASGTARPTFTERAFEGYRAYYRYLPKGKFTTEYTVRLNNAGSFEMPATRVEAMYAPEVFGESPVARMEVAGQ